MNVLKLAGIFSSAAAIVLEALPSGVVMNFCPDGSTIIRKTYAYFSLLPTGYAQFGPILAALSSCALLVMWICGSVFACGRKLYLAAAVLSAAATLASLSQLLFGFDQLTLTGGAISLLLAVSGSLAFLAAKMPDSTGKFE